MKTIKHILPIAILLSAISCQQEQDFTEAPGFTITLSAEAENDGETKAALAEGETTARFLWASGDRIGLPGEAETYQAKLSSGAGAATANFKVNMSAAEEFKYAGYPYNVISKGKLVYPEVYDNYKNGELPAPMLAVLSEPTTSGNSINYGEVAFKHTGAVIKIFVDNMPAGVNSMEFTHNDGFLINGIFTLKESFTTTNIVNNSWKTTSELKTAKTTFNFDATTKIEDWVFYVPVPAGTVFTAKGFSVTLKSDGTEIQKTKFPFKGLYSIARGKMLRGVEQLFGIRFDDSEEIVFSHEGETKTVKIVGDFTGYTNLSVKVSTRFAENYGTATVENDVVTVTLPSSSLAARGPVQLELFADGVSIDKMNVYQESWWITDRGDVTVNTDGSVTLSGSNARLKKRVKTKSFDYKVGIGANNLSSGHLLLEGEGADGISYQFRLGGGVKNNYSTAGAYTPDKTYTAANKTYNMNGLDLTFKATSTHPVPTVLPANTTVRFRQSVYTPGSADNLRLFARAWVGDELLLDDWGLRECPWFDGSGHEGTDQYIGVSSASGSLTIRYIEELAITDSHQQKDNKVILWDRFEQSSRVPEEDYWSIIPKGSAAWQYYMSGSNDQAYVENGVLVCKVESKDGKILAGAVDSQYKRAFKNCSIEIKARWPQKANPSVGRALWFMPQTGYATYSGWPNGGEIDLLEHNYGDRYVRQTLHSKYIHAGNDCTDSSNPGAGRVTYVNWPGDAAGTQWHTYKIDLTGNDVIFYVNGTKTATYSNRKLANEATVQQWPFSAPYYLILSIGGAGPIATTPVAADLPAYLYVDNVKVTAL